MWVWFKFPGLAILAILFSLTQVPFMMKHMHHPTEGEAQPSDPPEA